MALGCIDKTNGATNSKGKGCEVYNNNRHVACGRYNDEDFDSNSMCCACEKTGNI